MKYFTLQIKQEWINERIWWLRRETLFSMYEITLLRPSVFLQLVGKLELFSDTQTKYKLSRYLSLKYLLRLYWYDYFWLTLKGDIMLKNCHFLLHCFKINVTRVRKVGIYCIDKKKIDHFRRKKMSINCLLRQKLWVKTLIVPVNMFKQIGNL